MNHRQYTLDGESIDIREFIESNDFDGHDLAEIRALNVNDEIVYGGGAAAVFVLRRTG